MIGVRQPPSALTGYPDSASILTMCIGFAIPVFSMHIGMSMAE